MQVKLQVRYFDADEDLLTLNEWLKEWDHGEMDRANIPAIGFMVSEDDTPIAACFLRRCEGKVGILDGLATNPAVPGPLRHVAIDAAVKMLIEEAKRCEITTLIAWTQDASTLVRGLGRHGFRKLPDTMITKDLRVTPATH